MNIKYVWHLLINWLIFWLWSCFVSYQAASLLWLVNQRCTKTLVCKRPSSSSPRIKKCSILFQAEVWTMTTHCQLAPPSSRLSPQGRQKCIVKLTLKTSSRIRVRRMKWVLLFSYHIIWCWCWSNELACQSWSRRNWRWSSTCQGEIKSIYIISCFLPWISHIIIHFREQKLVRRRASSCQLLLPTVLNPLPLTLQRIAVLLRYSCQLSTMPCISHVNPLNILLWNHQNFSPPSKKHSISHSSQMLTSANEVTKQASRCFFHVTACPCPSWQSTLIGISAHQDSTFHSSTYSYRNLAEWTGIRRNGHEFQVYFCTDFVLFLYLTSFFKF